jgi:crotonobetainyl-CoA:carnitine CoA-transferase CaiB-like acyl-CoA transferase
MGGLPSQVLGSLLAAFATLIAVRASEEQGFGQLVDFSLFENQVTSHAQSMVEVSYLGQETGANTPRIPNEGRRLFAKDGPVMFSVMEQQLALLAELINAPAELAKSRPGERAGANPDLQRLITDWVGSRTQREVYEAGQAGHVPTSYSASPSDLLSSPQYESRNFLMPMTHGIAGELKVPGLPFLWMREEPPAIPAPLLGQHTEPLLRELLGLSRLDVKRLFQAGVL